jgi:hypothetical protein
MANFFNYPQVVMSLYDVPMEASGAMSLGTTAGVGSEQGLGCRTCAWEEDDFYGSAESYAVDQIVWGDWLVIGQERYGMTSHDADVPRSDYTDYGGFCQNTSYTGKGIKCMHIRCGCSLFFSMWQFSYTWALDIAGLFSHCITSNGTITDLTCIYNYCCDSRYLQAMWVDQSDCSPTNMIWVGTGLTGYGPGATNEGWICTYCYNSSGVLVLYSSCKIGNGTSSATGWMPEQLYSVVASGTKYLISSDNCEGFSSEDRSSLYEHGGRYLSLWCVNLSNGAITLQERIRTCDCGGVLCNNTMWGGCATHCYQSGGGFFITVATESVGRVDSWCIENNQICHVDKYDGNDADSDNIKASNGYCNQPNGYMCLLAGITGDDTHFYVMSCSAKYGIHGFTLSTSGIITRTMNSNSWWDNYRYGNTGHIFTCQGIDYIYAAGSGRSWPHCKPAPHHSISGLYGGADNTNVALSHYYKGGSYVTNTSGNSSVPTSGTIDFSDFRSQGN